MITLEWAKETCKAGQGAACCRYLGLGADGWACLKHTEARAMLDKRVADRTIKARGDNCPGKPP